MFAVDGNWIDIGSLLSGGGLLITATLLNCRGNQSKFISKNSAKLFADGIAIFPLLLLAISPISSQIIHDLETSSRLSMAIFGVFGLFAILEDIF
jgi:hypothetical protein